jgi:uncharacterized protein (TIGR04255 family)
MAAAFLPPAHFGSLLTGCKEKCKVTNMPRKQQALRLTYSPLVLALAQVRINPVLKMADHIPSIQEELRQDGYLRFQEQQLHEFVLAPQPRISLGQRWVFGNKEQDHAVVMSNSFMVLETSNYTRFEDFVLRLENMVSRVERIIGAVLSDRLGLRYVDLILPAQNETLEEYIHPNLRGLEPDQLSVERVLNQFESRGKTPLGQIVIRLHQNDNKMCLPPDLIPANVKMNRTLPDDSVVTLLDIDHFSERERELDSGTITEEFWDLHQYTDLAFRSSVTSTALQRWGADSGSSAQ